jgi:hypothetical protein
LAVIPKHVPSFFDVHRYLKVAQKESYRSDAVTLSVQCGATRVMHREGSDLLQI